MFPFFISSFISEYMETGIGRRIIITRAKSADSRFEDALAKAGLINDCIPLIKFAKADDWEDAVSKVRKLHHFDWVVFTSPRTVEFTKQALKGTEVTDARAACVSESTAECARNQGFDVQIVGQRGSAELAEMLLETDATSVLVPCGNLSSGVLQRTLRDANWLVQAPELYQTIPDADAQIIFGAKIEGADAVVFHSGSAVTAALGAVDSDQIAASRVYSFGPSATDVLAAANVAVTLEAASADQIAFAESIIDFERQLG